MEVREATHADIPHIVSLLKRSLGESLLPKTEEVWRFKHVDNPFGESLVLIAVLKDEIVGVRAFMRWSWMLANRKYKVYRAVDTGVLPEHQGKGIFRRLNLRAVEIAQERGAHFVFNTPNSQSLPGNLKMGWEEIEKIKIRLAPSKLYHLLIPKKNPSYQIEKRASREELEELLSVFKNRQELNGNLFTPKTAAYLHWRYEKNPLQKYEVYADKDIYLAGYIKDHARFTELRITEHLYSCNHDMKRIEKKVREWNKKFKAPVISIAPELGHSFFGISGNFGPVLTLKDLKLDGATKSNLLKLEAWSYTLGDLELF